MGNASSDIEHIEILLRLYRKDGSIIPPGVFLPSAERYNLITKIDRWVIGTTFDWLVSEATNLSALQLCSINLSGCSLGDEKFLDFLISKFDSTATPMEKICFEITETSAIANLQIATRFIHIFKERGCKFALDDFGSGFSSYGYLKKLPVDYLKIDGVFVKDLLDDPLDKAMVKSINEIGHIMGLQTIAEFAENDEILSNLQEMGIDFAQGYGIQKPQPIADFRHGLRNRVTI